MGGMSTHIVFLAETEESSDLRRTLRAKALRVHRIRQAGNLLFALLHDREREHAEIHGHNAAAYTLPLTLARPTGAIAGVAVAEEEAHASGMHDALLHGEALLVVAAGDAENLQSSQQSQNQNLWACFVQFPSIHRLESRPGLRCPFVYP